MLPNASTKVQSYAGQFNVQVVRGRVTTRCLWNACRALALGLVLLTLGTTMAVIGYYAEQLSQGDETQGNATVHVRYEARGFHLNNLSYAGPVVMGLGGFIVVAACVMTFEARDSAAKVMPAKLKPSTAPSSVRSTPRTSRSTIRRPEKRAVASQTNRSFHQHTPGGMKGVYRSPSAPSLVHVHQATYNSSPTSPEALLNTSTDGGACVTPALLSPGTVGVDLHEWNISLRVYDETRRKRLSRQKTLHPSTSAKKQMKCSDDQLRRSASTSCHGRSSSYCGGHRRAPASPCRHDASKLPLHTNVPLTSPTKHVCSAQRKSPRQRPQERSLSQNTPDPKMCQRTVPRSCRSVEQPMETCSSLKTCRRSSPDCSPSCDIDISSKAPPCHSPHVSDGSICCYATSPDVSPRRRLSRVSCPSPRRQRSLSPSHPVPSSRKASLNLDRPL